MIVGAGWQRVHIIIQLYQGTAGERPNWQVASIGKQCRVTPAKAPLPAAQQDPAAPARRHTRGRGRVCRTTDRAGIVLLLVVNINVVTGIFHVAGNNVPGMDIAGTILANVHYKVSPYYRAGIAIDAIVVGGVSDFVMAYLNITVGQRTPNPNIAVEDTIVGDDEPAGKGMLQTSN